MSTSKYTTNNIHNLPHSKKYLLFCRSLEIMDLSTSQEQFYLVVGQRVQEIRKLKQNPFIGINRVSYASDYGLFF